MEVPACRQLLGDRIEANIEDVLNEVVPPRAQTAPPGAGVRSPLFPISTLMNACLKLTMPYCHQQRVERAHVARQCACAGTAGFLPDELEGLSFLRDGNCSGQASQMHTMCLTLPCSGRARARLRARPLSAVICLSTAPVKKARPAPAGQTTLCRRVRPQANTTHVQGFVIADFLDAGHDLRLDTAYTDFYREQAASAGVTLPSPLDTQTLFNKLARRLLQSAATDGSEGSAVGENGDAPGVKELYTLVHGAAAAPPPLRAWLPAKR